MRTPSIFPLVLIALTLTGAAQQQTAAINSASGQPKPADQPAATLKIQAREVILPVTVRDKHGALVSSLAVSDFTLTEDGRPQKIKSFTRQSDLPYKLGLLVDTSRSVSGAMESERKAAGKFVDTMLPEKPDPNKPSADKSSPDKPSQAADEAFLIHFDHQVELLQDFTASRDKLHHELDDMGASSRSQDSRDGPETSDDDHDRSRGGRSGTQLYDAVYLASNEVMKPGDGRNALVLFSDGVDRGSKDTLNDAVDAADKANVVIYTIYFKGEQERGQTGFPGGGHHGGGYPGGGGGYPGGGGGYPGGGGGHRGGDEKQAAADGKKIMEQIATRTGGRFYEAKSTSHLEEIYSQIAEELRGQYLLTYTPDQFDKEGGYHKVALKANKDDLTVVTREGYYAPQEK
jgi:VWFA-related protein